MVARREEKARAHGDEKAGGRKGSQRAAPDGDHRLGGNRRGGDRRHTLSFGLRGSCRPNLATITEPAYAGGQSVRTPNGSRGPLHPGEGGWRVMCGRRRGARLRSRMESEQRGRNPPAPAGEAADGPAADTRSAVSVTETSEAETTTQRLDTGVSEARVPTWVWVVLGALGIGDGRCDAGACSSRLATRPRRRKLPRRRPRSSWTVSSRTSRRPTKSSTRSTSSSSPPPPPLRPRCRRHRRRKSSPNAQPRTTRAHDDAEVLRRRGVGLRL